jgi:hypothetical protein
MKRLDVEEMLDEISAQGVLRWIAFLAVREERAAEARQNAEDGFDDDEVHEWGEEPDEDEDGDDDER